MNLKIGTSHPSSNKVFFFKLINMKEKKNEQEAEILLLKRFCG